MAHEVDASARLAVSLHRTDLKETKTDSIDLTTPACATSCKAKQRVLRQRLEFINRPKVEEKRTPILGAWANAACLCISSCSSSSSSDPMPS